MRTIMAMIPANLLFAIVFVIKYVTSKRVMLARNGITLKFPNTFSEICSKEYFTCGSNIG